MSIRNLEYLFQPKSVAVVGASVRPRRVGSVVMKNLLGAEFSGPIMPVNPKYESVAGVLCYPDVESLPVVPELAVICTPPAVVPDMIARLGQRGTRAAIVLTAGLSSTRSGSGKTLEEEMLEATRPHGLRIIGPNCLGVLVPELGLNASFAHMPARPGKIAFVSQSGALCTAVLDWAHSKGIGFSHFVSLGNHADVDFGDMLDYLASDPHTRAILLYIESITHARKFMSAARAASRNKTVLAIKAGRVREGAEAAASHTGALAGSDDVCDAAIRRAGMLRVFSVEELFYAVETLARAAPSTSDRLTILTNGGGPGVLATDELISGGGSLTALPKGLLTRLDGVLPRTWSHGNPVDIIGDADGTRYERALEALLEDRDPSAILVMHVPTAISSSTDVAQAVVRAVSGSRQCVLTSWLGDGSVAEARTIFSEAGIPTYDTPEAAIRAFLHTVHYRENRETLMEVPPSTPEDFTPDEKAARAVIDRALAEGRQLLTEPEAKEVLAAYGIPVVETRIARTAVEARELATEIGFPVALKILSRDISHKSDVGGVVLDLDSTEAVLEAARAMESRISRVQPGARLEGFSVQRMARRPRAHELIVGVSTDSSFGPVILFGQGGTAVEVVRDQALALPPLNLNLARDLVSRTRVSRLLRGYRDRAATNLDAVHRALAQVSQLVVDLGELVELDINPLLADEEGVLALDARMVVRSFQGPAADRLAIRPYPRELEEWVTLRSGSEVLVRPIRPEDEPAHYDLFSHFDPEDIRFRFFGLVRSLSHSEMARYTQIDYDREMALIATRRQESGTAETLGVVRAVTDKSQQAAEFAIIIRSDLKGQGLGKILLEKIVRHCRERGLREIVGQVLQDNRPMLGLAKSLGFSSSPAEGGVVDVRLPLRR